MVHNNKTGGIHQNTACQQQLTSFLNIFYAQKGTLYIFYATQLTVDTVHVNSGTLASLMFSMHRKVHYIMTLDTRPVSAYL